MPISEVHNCDCLTYMRSLPDNTFDLLIADPPYGDGLHAEDGGGKGWFTKYNQRAPESDYNKARSQTVHVERERERESQDRSITDSETPVANSRSTSVNRTGGASSKWKTNAIYGKKLLRGTLPHRKNTSKKCSASHAIKSFGAAIISGSRRRAASLSGRS